jgi:hypothetical protein
MRLLTLFFSLLAFNGICQISTQNHTGSGDNVARDKITNNYYNKNRDETPILNFNKYINPSQQIYISVGTNLIAVDPIDLKIGIKVNEYFVLSDTATYLNIFTIRLEGNKLKASVDMDGFDEKYIARIKDNKLIAISTRDKFYITSTDSSFEVYDEYFQPTLQIALFKKFNCIYVGGIFNYDRGYYIIGCETLIHNELNEKKLLMRPSEKDSALNDYKSITKKLLPLEKCREVIYKTLAKQIIPSSNKKTKILNSIAIDLCSYMTKKKDSITTKKQYAHFFSIWFNKIPKKRLNELFIEQGEDITNQTSKRRIALKVMERIKYSCNSLVSIIQNFQKKTLLR